MTYVKISDTVIPATISGRISDSEWDGRAVKSVTLSGSFAEVDVLFTDGSAWSILADESVEAEDGTVSVVQKEYDNSEYSYRGDLTVHTDGTCTVKMGKATDLEDAYEMLFGGEM